MIRILCIAALGLVCAGCQQTILQSEPAPGTLRTGQKVLVDNGSCPAGQVMQVTGSTPGVARAKQCVPRPS